MESLKSYSYVANYQLQSTFLQNLECYNEKDSISVKSKIALLCHDQYQNVKYRFNIHKSKNTGNKILNSLFLGRRRLDSFLYSSSKNFDHMSMIKAFLKHVRYLEIVHFSLSLRLTSPSNKILLAKAAASVLCRA
jgi:hypothetical protein